MGAIHPVNTGHCHNCGSRAHGHFCTDCGQETRLHVASAREFVHEFVGHYIALEGKLWRTLALLLLRPGRLTAEYIAGRRVRYVQPLRIYLTFSILFFALLKYANVDVVKYDPPTPAQAAAKPAKAIDRLDLVVEEDQALRDTIAKVNPEWVVKAASFFNLPGEDRARILKRAFFEYMPYAMFGMMPLFALYLKLLYLGSGRRYGEHLLFALHTNAFAFILFGVLLMLPESLPAFLATLWLVAYLPLAMRRVYGGGRLATAARWLLLMVVHLATMLAVIAATMSFAVLR